MVKLSKYSNSFPNPRFMDEKDEIIAFGGDLNPNRILHAYRRGIFPWYSKNDPILWWSPNPRFILDLKNFKVQKSLQKLLNKHKYIIKFDTDFELIVGNCQKIKRKNQDGTWILDEVASAYIEIYKMGFAHCVGVYDDEELIGGLYGISIGGMFCGESMFSKVSNSSKIAFYYLVQKIIDYGFDFVDCQIPTQHLRNFGASEISRSRFLSILDEALLKKSYLYNWK